MEANFFLQLLICLTKVVHHCLPDILKAKAPIYFPQEGQLFGRNMQKADGKTNWKRI
jgi:hypothetical protein